MTVNDMIKVGKYIDEQLKAISISKIDMPCEEVEKKLRNMEREGYREKFYNRMTCNLKTCRYNQSGTCTNEEKRKECVEVSERVLCLEDRENER